jgi:hypothetical protein
MVVARTYGESEKGNKYALAAMKDQRARLAGR